MRDLIERLRDLEAKEGVFGQSDVRRIAFRQAADALEAAREDAGRYRAMRDDFLWTMFSGPERTGLTFHMPGVSLASIGPDSDEFDAAIDQARGKGVADEAE